MKGILLSLLVAIICCFLIPVDTVSSKQVEVGSSSNAYPIISFEEELDSIN